MDIAYLHLVTNHIPIIGVPFGLAVLLIGIWRNSDEIKALGLLIFSVLGLLTIGVYLLGQGGEDFVEDLAGVSHDSIEDHESMATVALITVIALGIASLFALARYGGFNLLRPRFRKSDVQGGEAATVRGFPRWIVLTIAVIALVASGVLGYTGRLGGKIRHTEFHPGTPGVEDQEKDGDEDREGGKRRGRNRGSR